MTLRSPLYYTDSGNFQEFSVNELNDIYSAVKRQFLASPSVTLTVVSSGGNLGNLSETQVIASPARSNNRAFGNNTSTLGNISTNTVNYSRVNQTLSPPASSFNVSSYKTGAFGTNPPIYMNDSGNFEPFTDSDFIDTFIKPAIQSFNSAASDPLYQIALNAATPAGYSRVSNTPIYTDNNANIAAYAGGALPEARTQSTVINNYYLVRKATSGVSNQRADVTYQEISVSGTGLKVNVNKVGTTYQLSINDGGQNYAPADSFKILGTELGGDTPRNDINFLVNGVDSIGAPQPFGVTALITSGTPVAKEYHVPMTHTQAGDFKVMPKGTFDGMIRNGAQDVATTTTGYTLNYAWNSGTQVGTAMIDTRLLNPTQSRRNYQTGDTYYSQRVPTGGTQTQVNTHYLGVTIT